MSIVAFRGATAWEAQIGAAWIRVNFPGYWLFSRTRSADMREAARWDLRCRCRRCRAWLFAWPISIGWERG